jgi:hypothetical protein
MQHAHTSILYILYALCLQQEKRKEQQRRGNPDTFTSDAAFDERFQLGYGLKESQVMGYAWQRECGGSGV